MESKMIKVGLVGIGGMGNVHFNAYRRMTDAKVVAVADLRVDMAREKTAGTDANIYATLEELLANEKCDIIDICTPSYLHTGMAITALEAGCNVISEKPMSVSTADTKRVIDTAKRVGKLFMTAHVVRFMSRYAYLRDLINSGELGKPVHIMMNRISSVPRWSFEDWMRDLNKSGGTPFDLSIHDLDFAYSVFGEPKDVNCVYHSLKDNNDYVVSNLIYDGFTVSATGAWYNAEIPFNASFKAIFENGYLFSEGELFVKNGEKVTLAVKEDAVSETAINIPRADGYYDELEYFINCVKTNTPPSAVTPESSEGSVKLVERLLASAIKI